MTTCTHHKSCVKDALKRADDICAQAGARLTPQRKQVLEFIWQSHKAHKAYDILEQMAAVDKSAKPPTVYRALDFLQEQGLVHKVQSLNAYIGCPNPDSTHTHQFLICETCGHIDDIHGDALSAPLTQIARDKNFTPKTQMIEVFGTCKACA